MLSRASTIVISGLLLAVLAATAAVSQETRDGALFLSEVEMEGESGLACGSMPAYRMGPNVTANNTTVSLARSFAGDANGCAAAFHFMNTSAPFQFRADARIMFHASCSGGVDGGELFGGTFGYELQKDGEDLGDGIHWGENTTGGLPCSGDPVPIEAEGIPTGDASFARGENLTLLIYARAGPSDPGFFDELEIIVADPWRPAALIAPGLPLGFLSHPETGEIVAGPGDPEAAQEEAAGGGQGFGGNETGNATTGAGVEMTTNRSAAAAEHGETAHFLLRVTGNGSSNATFKIDTRGLPPGWGADSRPSAGTVAPNETREVVLTVRVPTGAAEGEYEFEVMAGQADSAPSLPLRVIVGDSGDAPPRDENATAPSPAASPPPPAGNNRTGLEPDAESPGPGAALAAVAAVAAAVAIRRRVRS